MLFHQLAGNFFFQSKIIAELGTAGVALLNSGSNPCPPDRLSVEDLVHFAQHWEYSPQMAWSKWLLTYLPPLYNAFDKQNAMYSICLTDFPLPRRRYSIKRSPWPANPLHTCSAFSKWVMLSNSAAEFEPGSIYTDISGLKLYSVRLK